ncbi:fungal-specific transcription factor domain-containing protein [Pseudomassariella vexata]|uniref:Fungal-specific transcription factor domain-domain-containing protein n=1 Tax=Pseudomassariella vexata TaxID=1141098 RepID=A0A1Y2EDW8_9PEZI|nr:fungal-specific transcription factor domain-containing protein [Pseudomassariella vexata]ORY69607.1 fungal-specific transcription factor domain-domain-containing protein [Pseudomassariella vexata]
MSQWHTINSGSNMFPAENQTPNIKSASSSTSNSNSAAQAGPDPAHGDVPAETSTSAKRLACNQCRERKVRCDRQQPQCSRCAKVGSSCHYSSPSKQTISKSDLSRLLFTMHSRLEHAEAKLALAPPPLSSPQYTLPWNDMSYMAAAAQGQASVVSASELNSSNLAQIGPSSAAAPAANEWSYREFRGDFHEVHEVPFSAIAPTASTDFSMVGSGNVTPAIDSMLEVLSNSSYGEEEMQTTSKLPNSFLQKLYASFFDVYHASMPIVNRSRVHRELEQRPESIEVQALAHAIGALGALAVPEPSFAVETCYNQARSLVDICERQEDGAVLSKTNPLQTCVLLCLYEFRRPNFARAWITLGRAIRLAKISRLDSLDEYTDPPGTMHSSCFGPPSPVLNPADMEERRRTFWQLYILDGFAAMKTNLDPSFNEEQIPIPLPCRDELHEVAATPDMPTLQQVFQRSGNADLSSFAGIIIVISLYRRCFQHIQAWLSEPSYAFWDNYYQINKLFSHCQNDILASHLSAGGQESSDTLNLVLRMNLAAVEIYLHETAISKVEREKLPPALSADAVTRLESAAKKITETVRKARGLTAKELGIFQQSSPFLTWAITKAIEAYLWLMHQPRNDSMARCVEPLQILSSSMRLMLLPEHIRPGLLEQVDAKLAETEQRSTKRRHTTTYGFNF